MKNSQPNEWERTTDGRKPKDFPVMTDNNSIITNKEVCLHSEKDVSKVYWLVGSEEEKIYDTSTWYRCLGIEKFIKEVEKDHKIIGVMFEGNNLGFVIERK